MESKSIEELLLQLLQDMAVVKSKLDSIEEIKVDSKSMGNRIDKIEAQNERHEKQLKSLEHRANEIEQFTRNGMVDSRKQTNKAFISMGVAIFSAIISVLFGLLF